MKFALLTVALAGAMWAQDKPMRDESHGILEIPATKTTVPKITAEQQVAYFQAKADVLEAQVALQLANDRLKGTVEVLTRVCPLVLDAQQRPQCAPPPAPEAKK
jgi:hypothetical protein